MIPTLHLGLAFLRDRSTLERLQASRAGADDFVFHASILSAQLSASQTFFIIDSRFYWLYGFLMSLKPAAVADDFPARMKVVLRCLDLSREEFGQLAGISASGISGWLSGASKPSAVVFTNLSAKLDESTVRYLNGKSNKPPALVVRS